MNTRPSCNAGSDVSSVTYARVCGLVALPGGTVLVATEAPQSRSGIDRYTPEGAQIPEGSVQGMLAPVRSFCVAPMGRLWCGGLLRSGSVFAVCFGAALSLCSIRSALRVLDDSIPLIPCRVSDRSPCRAGLANGTVVVFDFASAGNVLVPLGCWQAHPSAVVSAAYLAPPAAAATPGGSRGFGRVFTLSEDGCIRGWSAGTPGPADDHALSAMSVRNLCFSYPTLGLESIYSTPAADSRSSFASARANAHRAVMSPDTPSPPPLPLPAPPSACFRPPPRGSRFTAR